MSIYAPKCFQVELADLLQALRKGSLWRMRSSLCGFSFCDLFVTPEMRFVMRLCVRGITLSDGAEEHTLP